MTVTYTAEVATSRGFGCFWKLLFRWRGSIYKLLWPDLVLYVFLYYSLSFIYRFLLAESQRRYFEKVSLYCKVYGDLIPVSFILGFYVSIVVKRWWDSFNCIPWPDTLAFFVSAYVHGQDERGRLMRRSIMRYANLAFVITLTCISPCVKKRFPTMDHLVEAGVLLPNEKKIMEQLRTSHSMYWMPLVWASSIAIRARKEGRIRDDFALNTLVEAIANYRSLCGGLYNYDWISIPLVYTQVVTLVVYTFFLATLMGRQYLDPDQGYPGYDVDLYVPVFNFLQFFFYMGWLKVAETLVNPFGEDDDDFEVNWVIDRDIQVSYLIVDEMHQEHPELLKDQYWDEVLPDLPYTAAAMAFYTEPPMGSAANLIIPPHEAEFVPLETVLEDDDELEDVKVNGGIPCEGTKARSLLSRNLSGSSYSGFSKLGQSFHPMSYERKGIFSMMQDLFSRDSSVRRKKKLWKAPSKSTLDPSLSCDTSGPPTPEELKTQRDFNDDIFRLSDLSLADSRGTGIAQSPGIFGNLQVADFFGRLRSARSSHRASGHVSTPGTRSPGSEAPDDENARTPRILKKQRAGSFKQLFHSGKYHGSEKSLLDSVHQKNLGSNRRLVDGDSEYLRNDYNDEMGTEKESGISPTNSDEDVTVLESFPNLKVEKEDFNKGVKGLQTSEPFPFERSPKSVSKVIHASNGNLGKMAKEPSTSTLVPANSSLEDTPPSTEEKLTDCDINQMTTLSMSNKDSKMNQSSVDCSVSVDANLNPNPLIDISQDQQSMLRRNSSIKPSDTEELKRVSNPQVQVWAAEPSSSSSSPKVGRLPPVAVPKSTSKGMFSRLRPKRAASLHINTLHDADTTSLSGMQRLRGHRAPFFRTISQPVSPTESLTSLKGGLFSRHSNRALSGFFGRRSSRGDVMPDPTDSHHSLVLEKNLKNSGKSSNV